MRGHGLVRGSLGKSDGVVRGNGEVIRFGALSFSWSMALNVNWVNWELIWSVGDMSTAYWCGGSR